ncbi:MAG TPA: hypothetical protein VLE74_01115, partial [Candidatus Saccharimonadales bacterium]|nr:hypothetical protein [Candidatus Saccharimonadales bacterium]
MSRYKAGKRKMNWSRIWLILAIVFLVVVAAAVFAVRRTYNQNLQPVSASQRAVLVTIPSGATVQTIGKQLQDQGLVRTAWAFEWYVRNHDA